MLMSREEPTCDRVQFLVELAELRAHGHHALPHEEGRLHGLVAPAVPALQREADQRLVQQHALPLQEEAAAACDGTCTI